MLSGTSWDREIHVMPLTSASCPLNTRPLCAAGVLSGVRAPVRRAEREENPVKEQEAKREGRRPAWGRAGQDCLRPPGEETEAGGSRPPFVSHSSGRPSRVSLLEAGPVLTASRSSRLEIRYELRKDLF